MDRAKKLNISAGFNDAQAREEFFRLPRVEFLLQETNPAEAGEIGKMVMNERLEIADRFSMEVPDSRMADAGICKGDYVVIQRRRNYRPGDLLAVKLGEKVFIRRYFPTANRIRLECATPDRQTMILDMDTPGFAILGCVVQVIREIG